MRFVVDTDYSSGSLVGKSFDYNIFTQYVTGSGEGVRNASLRYSVAGVELVLRGRYEKYLTLYYVPTVLITVASWIFFLLPSTSYPARTALLVTVFLLLINIFSSVVNETPNTNNGGQSVSSPVSTPPSDTQKQKSRASSCYQRDLILL